MPALHPAPVFATPFYDRVVPEVPSPAPVDGLLPSALVGGGVEMTVMMVQEEMIGWNRKKNKMWEKVKTEQKDEFTKDGLGMERMEIVNRDEKKRGKERRQISCC